MLSNAAALPLPDTDTYVWQSRKRVMEDPVAVIVLLNVTHDVLGRAHDGREIDGGGVGG